MQSVAMLLRKGHYKRRVCRRDLHLYVHTYRGPAKLTKKITLTSLWAVVSF